MELSNNNKIYIVCPAKFATGGTELLHQLFYKLKINHKQVVMYYTGDVAGDPVVERFKKYEIKYIIDKNEVVDEINNLLIVPETMTELLNEFRKIKKCIWWLSVDNYIKSRESKFKCFKKKILGKKCRDEVNFKDKNIFHLYQSEYSRLYLENKKVEKKMYLSDYLNNEFLNREVKYDSKERENLVLYNPKKGFEFTKKIIEKACNIKFIPLENMPPEEIIKLCQKSKVYIDFGNHPGKDRFPREASILGCLLITGKRGAAENFIDIPINEEYKFCDSENEIDKIIKKIEESFIDYDKKILEFEKYRKIILNEEKNFEKDVEKIFGR